MVSYNCYSTPSTTKFKYLSYSIISPKVLFPDAARDRGEILAKIRAVKKGDRIKDVVKQIAVSYSTEPYEIGEGSDKYGTRLIYNLTDSHGVYEDIVFWFGNDDRLVKVTTSTWERFARPRKLQTEEIELGVHQ